MSRRPESLAKRERLVDYCDDLFVKLDPKTLLWLSLAKVALYEGELDKSLLFAKNAHGLSPDDVFVNRMLADILYENNHKEAMDYYAYCISNSGYTVYSLLQIVKMLIESEKCDPARRFPEARKLLHYALQLDPSNQEAEGIIKQLDRFERDGFVMPAGTATDGTAFPAFCYPKLLSVFLTTRCNLKCMICNRDNFKGVDLEFENLYKLKNAICYADTIDLTGWGECFLYKRFNEVLAYIYSLRNDRCLQITTNGTLLSGDIARLMNGHLQKMIISLNASTPFTYNRDMKHGDFVKTTNSIKEFMDNLGAPDRKKVSLHFVAHTENIQELPEFLRLAKSLGVPSVSVGNYLISQQSHAKYSLLNMKDEYNRIIELAEQTAKKENINFVARKFGIEQERSAQLCKDPFDSCFIQPNGEISSPCCFSGTYVLGNVYETSFESVWFSDKYEKLRKSRHLEACKVCVPFTRFDEVECHFMGDYKKTDEFEAVKKLFR